MLLFLFFPSYVNLFLRTQLLLMVSRERLVRYPALLAKYSILSFVSSIKMKLKEQAIKASI